MCLLRFCHVHNAVIAIYSVCYAEHSGLPYLTEQVRCVMSYRLHQTVGAPPLLTVVWAKLSRHPQGGVCPVGMGAARPRWRAVPVRPPRRGHTRSGGLLLPPHTRASGPILLHQDEGGIEQATTPRAGVGPRG